MIILDLDNCIADDGWRISKIDWNFDDPNMRYHRYHSLAPFDTAANHDLIERARQEGYVISTARPIFYRHSTEEWLKRLICVKPMGVFMRGIGDHRKSVELKKDHLVIAREIQHLAPSKGVGAAFDDRPDVVSMYIEQGIPAFVRKIHDLCAYTRPQEKT